MRACEQLRELLFADVDILIIFSAPLGIPGLRQECDETLADPFSSCGWRTGRGSWTWQKPQPVQGSPKAAWMAPHGGSGETELLFPAPSQGRQGTPCGGQGITDSCAARGHVATDGKGMRGYSGSPKERRQDEAGRI